MKKKQQNRESFAVTPGYVANMQDIMASRAFVEWTKSQVIRHAVRELARRVNSRKS